MKVLMISQDFWPLKGGISSYLMEVYKKYFSKTQFEAIIPLTIKENTKNRFFKVHKMEFAPFDFKNAKRRKCNRELLKKVREIAPDILLFGYLRSHPEIGEAYKKINRKSRFGIFLHGKEAFIEEAQTKKNNLKGIQKGYTLKEAEFYKKILNSADVLFSVSNFTKEIIKRQGINNQILTIYPSLNITERYKIAQAKKRLGLEKKRIVLSVGRLIKRKGHLRIIRVLPSLINEIPAIRYIIVGNGPEKENLEKEIKKRKLEEIVKMHTSVSDSELSLFYSACDVFVLPCSHLVPNDVEGFGIVFLEANAYKKPVIGTHTGGIPEAIINNETGYLIDPKNSRELKRKILKLLENSNLRKKMGEKGRKRVISQFNSKPSNDLINLFKKDTLHH